MFPFNIFVTMIYFLAAVVAVKGRASWAQAAPARRGRGAVSTCYFACRGALACMHAPCLARDATLVCRQLALLRHNSAPLLSVCRSSPRCRVCDGTQRNRSGIPQATVRLNVVSYSGSATTGQVRKVTSVGWGQVQIAALARGYQVPTQA